MSSLKAVSVFCLGMLGTIAFLPARSVRGEGYLAKLGPVPLRFQLPHPFTLTLPPLAMNDSPMQTNAAVKASENARFTGGDLSQWLAPGSGLYLPSPLWTQLAGRTNNWDFLLPPPTSAPAKSVPAASASDLLVITPQMLLDYFKPGQNPENEVVPPPTAPVGFTPATPAGPGSSAIYRSP